MTIDVAFAIWDTMVTLKIEILDLPLSFRGTDRKGNAMATNGASRKQCNVIYKNFKNGNITLPKGFAHWMYETAEMSAYAIEHTYGPNFREDWEEIYHVIDATKEACSYICEGRIDLAQAVIDGKKVETAEVVDNVIRHTVTQEDLDYFDSSNWEHIFDHIDGFGFLAFADAKVGDILEREEYHSEYFVA